ncbi:MAG: hypothetical protein EOP42_11655 [Sphingobacteriaceae bacterium]|nr:MAG: hypothetical protein EOP42_11655 [Sphingobacteriaceae bacterium]
MNLEPLHVPYRYNAQDAPEQKVIFALGQLGEANPQEIIAKLIKVNPQENLTEAEAETILKNYFDQGLIKGDDEHGAFRYNLSKILKPNSGRTNVEGLEEEL